MSGEGWAGHAVRGRTTVGMESAAPPPRLCCRGGRGPRQGLLGKWWAFGKEGATAAGAGDAAASPGPQTLHQRRWEDLGPEAAKGNYGNPRPWFRSDHRLS